MTIGRESLPTAVAAPRTAAGPHAPGVRLPWGGTRLPPRPAAHDAHGQPIVVGVSHRTAGLDVLERCAMAARALPALIAELPGPSWTETVILATCNRTEVYGWAADPAAAGAEIAALLAAAAGTGGAAIAAAAYTHVAGAAAAHLFRVASSLDSMVIGEPEIQGQVRRAWTSAAAAGSCGPELDVLFRTALQAGRRVRRDTRLGAGRVSVPSVAIDLAARSGSLRDRSILIAGAGPMGSGLATHLAARGARDVIVASRDVANAAALAAPHGWGAVTLTGVPSAMARADVVFCATGSRTHLITRSAAEADGRGRGDRALTIIDLALPRNVDPGVGELAHVALHDLEEIHRVAAAGAAERERQAALAEEIVAREVERYALRRPALAVPA